MSQLPVVCDLSRLDPAARRREQELLARFRTLLRPLRHAEDGWVFTVPEEPQILGELGELLALERVCCPFLAFSLQVSGGTETTLTITGPPGSTELIRTTFEAAGDEAASAAGEPS